MLTVEPPKRINKVVYLVIKKPTSKKKKKKHFYISKKKKLERVQLTVAMQSWKYLQVL